LTRDQLSCCPVDIFRLDPIKGGTDSVARPGGGPANAPETGRNNTRSMMSSWDLRPAGLICSADDIDRKSSCRAFSPQVAEWRPGFRSGREGPHARFDGQYGCNMNSARIGSRHWRS